jgi:hypothetical protein
MEQYSTMAASQIAKPCLLGDYLAWNPSKISFPFHISRPYEPALPQKAIWISSHSKSSKARAFSRAKNTSHFITPTLIISAPISPDSALSNRQSHPKNRQTK